MTLEEAHLALAARKALPRDSAVDAVMQLCVEHRLENVTAALEEWAQRR